jgi:plasmid maintenance system antidote protein VapI
MIGALVDKVKRLIDAGSSITGAIKESLGQPVAEFADTHGLPRTHISAVINGARRPTSDDIAALITELGGTEDEWRQLLWEAGRPVKVAS